LLIDASLSGASSKTVRTTASILSIGGASQQVSSPLPQPTTHHSNIPETRQQLAAGPAEVSQSAPQEAPEARHGHRASVGPSRPGSTACPTGAPSTRAGSVPMIVPLPTSRLPDAPRAGTPRRVEPCSRPHVVRHAGSPLWSCLSIEGVSLDPSTPCCWRRSRRLSGPSGLLDRERLTPTQRRSP
jgi:hypothetical protein